MATQPHSARRRILALAHHFEELLDTGAVETQAELAELAKLTPARVTQIINLLGLAPDIREEIFFLPPVTEGRTAITERHLRQVLKTVVWSEPREMWAELRQRAWAAAGPDQLGAEPTALRSLRRLRAPPRRKYQPPASSTTTEDASRHPVGKRADTAT